MSIPIGHTYHVTDHWTLFFISGEEIQIYLKGLHTLLGFYYWLSIYNLHQFMEIRKLRIYSKKDYPDTALYWTGESVFD